jgi:hypothetical protein
MDILLDILIIVAATVGCAIISIGIVVLLAMLFDDKNMVEYPLTHVEECNGDCTTCNEEIKEVCKEIQP